MAEVTGAAEALGISYIRYPDWKEDPVDGIGDFMLATSRASAKIKLSYSKGSKRYSVNLGEKTRGLIEDQILVLRNIIAESDLSDAKKRNLFCRLHELSVELSQPRVSFARAMSIIAAVSMGVAATTTFLADAPRAIATIASLLGHDKAAEDDERERLGRPPAPKALPPPTGRLNRSPTSRLTDVIDDDIPF